MPSDWRHAGCQGDAGDGWLLCPAGCDPRILFPFLILFLFLVTNLCRAWHPCKRSTKNFNFAGLQGRRVVALFLLSFGLIIPTSLYSRGNLDAFKDYQGFPAVWVADSLFGENSPRPELEGSPTHAGYGRFYSYTGPALVFLSPDSWGRI